MAVTPFKTFISGEVLTAADLNSSFTQITDNGEDLSFPSTKAVDFDGQSLLLDADQDTHITADTDDRIDFAVGGSDHFRMLVDSGIPDFRSEWGDAGATEGPYISIYRNSASPADEDFIGAIRWIGENDLGTGTVYAKIRTQVADVTDGSEDARLIFMYMSNGTLTEHFRLGAGANARLTSLDTDANAHPIFSLFRDSASPADDDIGGRLNFEFNNDAAEQTTFAAMEAVAEDVTDGTEDGYLQFSAIRAGAEVKSLSPGILLGPFATTSGTTVDVTGIPTTARKLTLMFNSVSADAADDLIIQLGDSGGIEATDYGTLSAECEADSVDLETNTAGFQVSQNQAAAVTAHGMIILCLSDASTNTWMGMSMISSGGSKMSLGTTFKSLSAAITQLRLTSTAGTAVFDGGSFSVLVE